MRSFNSSRASHNRAHEIHDEPLRIRVLGLDDFNREILQGTPPLENVELDPLLSLDEVVEMEKGFSFRSLLSRAEEILAQASRVDGIVNHWDFPGSCLHPLLCERNGLPGPSPVAVARCEHKYWARRCMQETVPEHTPDVCTVNPLRADAAERISLDFPYWLKPIISHSSFLAFRIDDETDLDEALAAMREDIGWFGEPFNEFLELIDLPSDFPGQDGCHAIAETVISADRQFTFEGYVYDGNVVIYGVIDSLKEPGRSSFSQYQYPSQLPQSVIERASDVARRVLAAVELDHSCFNIEFFWDEESDRLSILEVNTRISKSHTPLFLIADGSSQHKVAMELALGREPEPWQAGKGSHEMAAKFMVRLYQDAVVKALPDEANLDALHQCYPEALISILVERGQRLSQLEFQDSYSFEVADLFIGCSSEDDVQERYRVAMELLPFEFDLIAPRPIE